MNGSPEGTNTPLLHIDQLHLHLPPGYGHRAAAIARATAHELARLPLAPGDSGRTLASVQVPPLQIRAGESDRAIARRIARGIHQQLAPGVAGAAAPLTGGAFRGGR